MKLDFNIQINQKQGLALTAQVQQAIKLLHMTNLEIQEFVHDQFQDNPFIETDAFSEQNDNSEKAHAENTDVDKSFQENPYAKQETETTTQEVVTEVTTDEEKKEDDSKLEEYSKGVQSRIAKLTRKMREAERKEAAAVQYAQAVEKQRQLDLSKLNEVNTEYTTKLEENVTSAMESAQNELRMAIESQDANLQVTANKKIAALALENANLQMRKKQKPVAKPVVKVEEPVEVVEIVQEVVVEKPVIKVEEPVVIPAAVKPVVTEGEETDEYEEVFEEYEDFDEEKYNEYMDTYEDQYED